MLAYWAHVPTNPYHTTPAMLAARSSPRHKETTAARSGVEDARLSVDDDVIKLLHAAVVAGTARAFTTLHVAKPRSRP